MNRKWMRLYALLAGIAVVVLGAGCTKGYEAQRTAGDLTITLYAASYPLVKGDNHLTVKIADKTGKSLQGAAVGVRYYMPPMPGMAPMGYNAQVTGSKGSYAFTANIPMEGGWRMEVAVTPKDGGTQTATFNVDVS